MQSMTYGVMPTRKAFYAAFNRECPDGYNIQLGTSDSRAVEAYRLGDGVWTVDELYDACREIADSNGSDPALSLVSTILETLGFEWV